MNKSQILLLLFILIGPLTFSQGIDFQHITFEEALIKAQKEDKLIFIDFHTAWCGPCKKLAKGPFKDSLVGDYYNRHFINLKLDAEREGKQAAELFTVRSYPTLIFVDGDSQMVYRGTGSTMIKSGGMIPFAKLALKAATSDEYSLEDMQRLFPEKLNDEAFLKKYLNILVKYKMDPIQALDAWLSVQTDIEESSGEMLDLLLKYGHSIYLGCQAETVLRANYNHYLTIVPKKNKIRLERIENLIAMTTLKRAYHMQDPELMRRYLDKCKENNIGAAKNGKLGFYEMEYLRLANNNEAYKKAAVAYVDSIIDMKSVKQIKKDDAESYNKFLEFTKDKSGVYIEYKRKMMKQGKIATRNVKDIMEVCRLYWSRCETKEDYRHLKSWIKYCYKLIPGYWEVNNLEADLIYTQGQVKKAIDLKQTAIDNVPFNFKKKPNLEYQLQLMKQGKTITVVPIK
ncbi:MULTISPECIES: thioredoxin family protein [unclassified Carboxylicivirga]|uniref:thioredoxin family protein n=1 Tax=Carboxylicivirga TaxID=1628153 RepID=UPI003D33530E